MKIYFVFYLFILFIYLFIYSALKSNGDHFYCSPRNGSN